jgi:hypothetical protein
MKILKSITISLASILLLINLASCLTVRHDNGRHKGNSKNSSFLSTKPGKH